MELLLGFAIAVLIAITGVGAGSLIAPLLILFLHVPVAEAIGTALVYSAAVKIVVVPVQIWRRQIAWRTLAIILATGIPGVALGSLIFQRVAHNQANNFWIYLALGVMIAVSSAWHVYRHFRPATGPATRSDSPGWLAFVGKEAYRGTFRERPELGEQSRKLGETRLFVLPSTSPANAAVPYTERLRWFRELRESID